MTSLRGVTAKQAVLRLHRVSNRACVRCITEILQLRRNREPSQKLQEVLDFLLRLINLNCLLILHFLFLIYVESLPLRPLFNIST